MLLNLWCAYELPQDLVRIKILIQFVWVWDYRSNINIACTAELLTTFWEQCSNIKLPYSGKLRDKLRIENRGSGYWKMWEVFRILNMTNLKVIESLKLLNCANVFGVNLILRIEIFLGCWIVSNKWSSVFFLKWLKNLSKKIP